MTEFMKCGGTASCLTWREGKYIPCCSKHHYTDWLGQTVNEDALTVIEPPDLSARMAHCTDCGNIKPSNEWEHLAFFHYWPDKDRDDYYCGCRGWD